MRSMQQARHPAPVLGHERVFVAEHLEGLQQAAPGGLVAMTSVAAHQFEPLGQCGAEIAHYGVVRRERVTGRAIRRVALEGRTQPMCGEGPWRELTLAPA